MVVFLFLEKFCAALTLPNSKRRKMSSLGNVNRLNTINRRFYMS